MTTKYKIITGFLTMVLLIGMVVVLGYWGLQKSSDGFQEYRRYAILNVGMSDLGTAINGASDEMRAFISTGAERDLQQTKVYIAEGLKQLDAMQEQVRGEQTQQLFQDLRRELEEFNQRFDAVVTGQRTSADQYAKVMLPSVEDFMQGLASMSEQARTVDNLEALFRISGLWSGLLKQISAISRFSATLAKEDSDLITGYMTVTQKSLEHLGQVLTTEGGRRTYNALNESFRSMNAAFASMDEQNALVRSNLADITAFTAETRQKILSFNADVDRDMRATGSANLQNNDDTQNRMMVTGGVGLLLGMAIAVFIVLGIVRVLGQMAAFAGAVARGNFDHEIKVTEKGEIGAMIAAMREIPAVLGRIIRDAEALSASIRRGLLRERFDTSEFSGSFAQLSHAVNTVANAFTIIIDAMPTPMFTANKDGKALFFNAAGTAVAGDGLVGHACREALNAEACGNQNCFGKRAMQSNAPVSGETEAVLGGQRRVLNATAMPLHDENGAVAGYMELVTDLTELKQKEETMREVARQASEISDRVAAAAEELAAQVEEISRGAEVQRSRVESTASAMSQMTATVTEVAQSAGRASGQTEDTRARAEQGAGLVNEVVAAINEVNTVSLSLQQNMQELGDQAEGIGGVMNVISDIADQTNLLALNAAIEAARAGEAGRGFAVVADEVRKLAEKTMAATHEVGGSIDAIQHSTKTNIGNVEQAVRNVGQATDLANASGGALAEIVELASSNSDVVSSIATAAEEQSATSEEINRAVDEISRITAETADGMVQSSEAVQELSRMAQELRRVMEGLR